MSLVPIVLTRPGLRETTTKPSSFNFKAHLTVAIHAAALVIPYADEFTMPMS